MTSKHILRFLVVLMFTVIFLIVVSMTVSAASIATTKTSLNVDINSTASIYLTGQSTDAVGWSSSNNNVVTIVSYTSRKAVVKGVGEGCSVITATDSNGDTASCKVAVVFPPFEIEKKKVIAVEKETYDPGYNTIIVLEGSAVRWESSNSDIVSIRESTPSYASINAESVGTAIITATDQYGTKSKCSVRVRQEDFQVTLGVHNSHNSYDYDRAVFSTYWEDYHEPGYWDEDYNYYESYDDYDCIDYYDVGVTEGTIAKCTSSNNKVVVVKKNEYGVYSIHPKGVGSAVVTVTDPYGEKIEFKCVVYLSYFLERESGVKPGDDSSGKKYSYRNMKYGTGILKGVSFCRAKVSVTIKGKTYKGTANKYGTYRIHVPRYLKIHTPIKINIEQYGITKSYEREVVNNNPKIKISSLKQSDKKIKVTLKGINKGDYAKIIVGKKTYTKKIRNDDYEVSFKIKTKKLKKGQKIKVRVFNKFKQKLVVKTSKVKS